MAALADETLTGLWLGDDKAVYYVRHHQERIWWVGLSADSPLGADEFHPGVRFSNVFCGRLIGNAVLGEWADTPRGDVPQNGLMDLAVESDSEMRVVHKTGGFGGTAWRRVKSPARINITARFAEFDDISSKSSQTYVETAVVHGIVVTEPSLLDGDIVLSVRPDLALCRLPGVPTRLVDQPLRCRIPDLTGSTLLPGWKQRDGNSVMFGNGHPINGDVVAESNGSVRILGRRITPGTEVRLAGFLSAQPAGLKHGAEANTRESPLLSPVYSIDIANPVARGTLTGTWTSDDHGMYYLRQVGNTLWWMGLSHDQGRSFSNVFCGVITQHSAGIVVSGDLVDVPLGTRRNASRLTLCSSENTTLAVTEGSARRWVKLSDTSGR